ncbi:MAG: hypothetical protein OES25_03900 [Acidobacteriota bacterium]|nr:hypothetical protein [Acidobacteriota bacterium]
MNTTRTICNAGAALLIVLGLSLSVPARSEESPTGVATKSWQTVVQKMGGAEPDFSSIEARGNFVMSFGDQVTSVPQQFLYQLPDRIRSTSSIGGGELVVIVNGDSGVTRVGDRSLPMVDGAARAQIDELRRSFFSLIHNAGDPSLSIQKNATLDGNGCSWLEVSLKPIQSSLCVSDNGTIVRQTHKGRHPIQQSPGTLAFEYGDYRDVEGRWIPHRWEVSFDGSSVGRVELDSITFKPSFDDQTFRVAE